jgi:plasmid maintenance system antidote protein VapI
MRTAKTEFGKLLYDKKFTQMELSRLANVSQSNISIYCNYRDALEASTTLTRIRLSKAFNMTIQEFESKMNLKPSIKVATNKQEATHSEIREVFFDEVYK